MTPKAGFRLLLAAVLLAGIGSALAALWPGDIAEDWRTIAEWNGNGGIYESLEALISEGAWSHRVAMIVLLTVFLVFLVSVFAGLFFFWRFARVANVVSTILFLLLAPFSGLVILMPLEAGLYDLTMLCEGAVIALSYTQPIKGYFESRQVTQQVTAGTGSD